MISKEDCTANENQCDLQEKVKERSTQKPQNSNTNIVDWAIHFVYRIEKTDF